MTEEETPKSQIDVQREEAEEVDVPQDAPAGFQPQPGLGPDQTPGIEERAGEQPEDIEENVEDQLESSAEQNDDESVDEPEEGSQG